MNIQERLFSLSEKEYKNFTSKLIPSLEADTIIGVRIPKIRALAKEIKGTPEAEEFLLNLPHSFFEENCLHAYLVEQEKDFEKCLELTEKFLPYIDNWSVCDTFSPKVFKKNSDKLYVRILVWLKSDETFTVRFAVDTLMRYYLDDAFSVEHLELLSQIETNKYYIKMAIAWYFATALAKKYDETLPYITEKRLDDQTHNKAIQKAIESRRIDNAKKDFLRTLKIKSFQTNEKYPSE